MQPSPFIFGEHSENTLRQLTDVASRAEYTALMADGHLGYVMPIGGVAAYDNRVSIAGVGFDIACGNAAIRTDVDVADLKERDLLHFAERIERTISFGIGRGNKANDAPVDHPLFESTAWKAIPGREESVQLKARGRDQLGTVGSGNHYVDLFEDEAGKLWIGVHFGSRGLGHTVASGFLALAQGKTWGERAPEKEVLLDLNSDMGASYWELMELCGTYAYAGREWVARKVLDIVGGNEIELIHNHHNFAWKETHHGRDLIVVRKGATPAFPGQKGFVGGSMGDSAYILAGASHGGDSSSDGDGRDNEDKIKLQEGALFSTVHGAGRVMSRTAARGKSRGWGKKAKIISPGLVSWDMVHEWLRREGVILRGGGLDEAPQVYRRLNEVVHAQKNTVEILHTLRPLVVVMAGENEFDPYKD